MTKSQCYRYACLIGINDKDTVDSIISDICQEEDFDMEGEYLFSTSLEEQMQRRKDFIEAKAIAGREGAKKDGKRKIAHL